MWCWPLRCFFGTFTSGTWAWPLADSAEIFRSWGNAAMPHISMLMRKNLLVNISKLVRDMRNFFAVPHLTRKTFAVYQQVAEYDCADDIEYRGAAMQPISTLTRIFPEYSSKQHIDERHDKRFCCTNFRLGVGPNNIFCWMSIIWCKKSAKSPSSVWRFP